MDTTVTSYKELLDRISLIKAGSPEGLQARLDKEAGLKKPRKKKGDPVVEIVEEAPAQAYDVTVPVAALANLLMFGAADDLLGGAAEDVQARHQAIKELKDAACSKADLSNEKFPELDLNKIDNNMKWDMWKWEACSCYIFNIADHYSQAIKATQNYEESSNTASVIKYHSKDKKQWIVKSWLQLTRPALMDKLKRIKEDTPEEFPKVGFVAIPIETKKAKTKKGDDMLFVTFNDGCGKFTGVVWSDRRTGKLPRDMVDKLKLNMNKPCIIKGALKVDDYVSYTIYEIVGLLQ